VAAPEVLARSELVERLRAIGKTAVITLAGPVPLEEWRPYGTSTDKWPLFHLWDDATAVDVAPESQREPVLGVWRFC
jgi:hypothetical protein